MKKLILMCICTMVISNLTYAGNVSVDKKGKATILLTCKEQGEAARDSAIREGASKKNASTIGKKVEARCNAKI